MSHKSVSQTFKRYRAATLLALLTMATCAFWAQDKKAEPLSESLPPGAMQGKATTACLECHEPRIIVQQRLSKAAWTKEVDKMMKWGATVDPADREALIDYLSTNFSPDQSQYIPPRSLIENRGPKKNK
jgi:mono/diheme cytochrome c family protein